MISGSFILGGMSISVSLITAKARSPRVQSDPLGKNEVDKVCIGKGVISDMKHYR